MLPSTLASSLRATVRPSALTLITASSSSSSSSSSRAHPHPPPPSTIPVSSATLIRTYATRPTPQDQDAEQTIQAGKGARRQAHEEAAAAAAATPSSAARTADPQSNSQQQQTPLRQGPSAFDIDTSLLTIADQAAEGASGGAGTQGGRTGARARSDAQQSSIERSRRNMRRALGLIFLGSSGVLLGNMARDWDTVKERDRFAGNPLSDSAIGRMRLRLSAMWEDFHAPVWEKLLPDPLPYPYHRPYTLVVDLDELLVHSHWTREHGWRTAKRPGLDYFLAYLSQFWEIVIWTTQPYYVVAPVIEKLDPDRRYVAYTLFRESCRTHNGKVVKDLSALNRDLNKVVVLDVDAERFSMQPENGVLIKKWDGNPRDAELMGMLPFLEAIGIYQIPDVRGPIKTYEGQHIPTEYNKRQREVAEAEEARWLAEQEKRARSTSLSSWFGGLKSSGSSSSSSSSSSTNGTSSRTPSGRPKTFYELERERYQAGYAEDQKYWKENGEALRQQGKEDQERQMKEMKLSAWGMITGQGLRPPTPPEGQQQQQQQ